MRPRSPRRRRESRSRPQGSAWSRCLSGRAEGSSPVSESSTAWCCGTSRGQSREPAQRCSPRQPETDVQTADGSDQLLQSRPGTTIPGSGKGHQDWCSFDSIETTLLMRAVRKHTDCPWVLLYIERWLKAPVQMPDGSLAVRERGTPQGGVVSPVLANLFLHYAFDVWMHRNHPGIPFERYADDAICHCSSEEQAAALRVALENRFAECGLTLHPEKTKIVYCKDDDRRGDYPNQKFDFLGYTFRPRLARRRAGKIGVSFSPAVSNKALKAIRQTVRRWSLQERSDKSLDDLARMFNAHIRGWINYYGRFYPSALYPTLRHIDVILARWACRKFKALYRHRTRAIHWLERIARRQTRLFAHWSLLYGRGRTMGAG